MLGAWGVAARADLAAPWQLPDEGGQRYWHQDPVATEREVQRPVGVVDVIDRNHPETRTSCVLHLPEHRESFI